MNDKKPYALLEKEFSDLRRLYSSLVDGIEGINKELETLRTENIFYKKQLINADRRVEISKQTVIDNIMQSQVVHDDLVAEIIELKAERKTWQLQ